MGVTAVNVYMMASNSAPAGRGPSWTTTEQLWAPVRAEKLGSTSDGLPPTGGAKKEAQSTVLATLVEFVVMRACGACRNCRASPMKIAF
jgi:hypothetical protein